MKEQDYHFAIEADISPAEAMDRISQVREWWTKGFEGQSERAGDTFTTRFGDTSVDFEVAELVPGRKIVWKVVDCNLPFTRDRKEWKDTTVVWELSGDARRTTVSMTHHGLVPQVECYELCKTGWNFYVGESLRKLLTEGKGLPDGKVRKEHS